MSPLPRNYSLNPPRLRRLLHGAALCAVALIAFPPECLAQDDFFHSCTLNAGGGWTPVAGADAGSLKNGWNFNAGGGFGGPRPSPGHAWSFFVTANFLFDQLGVSQTALQNARVLNPTNIGLLSATSAQAKFYSTTLDPTVRFPAQGRFQGYAFAGFGWMRRSIDFNGTSYQGGLLQPSTPTVFAAAGNSGAYDAGVGANVRLPGAMNHFGFYAEVRVVHGLAVNRASTLIPVSAGFRW